MDINDDRVKQCVNDIAKVVTLLVMVYLIDFLTSNTELETEDLFRLILSVFIGFIVYYFIVQGAIKKAIN